MPTRIAELETAFTANTREVNRAFTEVERRAKESASKVNSSMGSIGTGRNFLPGLAQISDIIQGLPQIGRLASALISPFTDAAQAGIQLNMVLETAKLGFEGMSGSAEKASAHVKDLQTFAIKTPFRFEGLLDAARFMSAFGFSMEEQIPKLRAWGNAVAASGDFTADKIHDVVRAFGQMRIAGRVSGQEMNQLVNANIPGWELLAKAIGKTIPETKKLAEANKLNSKAAVDAITAMMEIDPRYRNMMQRMEGTLSGRLSAAQDTLQVAQATATRGLSADISTSLGVALSRSDLADTLATQINSAISPVSGMVRAAAVGLLGGSLTGGLVEGITAGKDAVTGTVRELGLSTISTLASAIGAQSPATEFIKLGESAAEGFALGYQKGMQKFTVEQIENARKIVQTGKKMGATPTQIKSALATGLAETGMRNLPYGMDKDNKGVFQQRDSWGSAEARMNIEQAARMFFEQVMKVSQEGTIGQIAQRVQRSGVPDAYDKQAGSVDALLNALKSPADWQRLSEFAKARGFRVTSTTGGRHNVGSKHYRGMAIDVGTREKSPEEISSFMAAAQAAGIKVRDERSRPAGQKVWGGPHLHLEGIPVTIAKLAAPAQAEFKAIWVGAMGSVTVRAGMDPIRMAAIPPKSNAQFPGLANPDLLAPLGAGPREIGEGYEEAFQKAGAAAGSFYNSVVMRTDEWKQDLASVPQQSRELLAGFFSDWDQGFKGAFQNTILGFAQMVEQMVARAASARLVEALGLGEGGWFSKILGSVLGGIAGGRGMAGAAGPASGATMPVFGPIAGVGGFRASGGPVWAGQSYIVGEQGREMITMGANAYVTPNHKLGSTNITNNIYVQGGRNTGSYVQRRSDRELAENIAISIQGKLGS